MKKKTKLLIIIILFTVITGCTKTLKGEDKKVVTNPETGQSLTSNILCQPTDQELYDLYYDYNDDLQVELQDLPKCREFTPSKLKYQSLWETIFVKPLAYIILKLGYLFNDMGLSVMLIGFFIRLLLFPLQIKTIKQSEQMKKIQPEMQKIEKKYKDKTDQESMMMKSQETMALYKKYKVNPVGGCLSAFIQLPIFFAFLEAINRVPAIFEGTFLNTPWNLGMTPGTGIGKGYYSYIILIVLIVGTTWLSFRNTMAQQSQNSEMAQQMKMMTTFMIVMIAVMSFSLPTAIALYWVVTNGFAVIQNLIVKKTMGKKD